MSLLMFYFLIAVSEKISIRTQITERLSGTVQFQNKFKGHGSMLLCAVFQAADRCTVLSSSDLGSVVNAYASSQNYHADLFVRFFQFRN